MTLKSVLTAPHRLGGGKISQQYFDKHRARDLSTSIHADMPPILTGSAPNLDIFLKSLKSSSLESSIENLISCVTHTTMVAVGS